MSQKLSRLSSVLLLGFYSFSLTVDHPKPAKAELDLKDFDYWASLCNAWEEAVGNKKYEDALKSCDNALAINSNQPQLWLDRGNVLLAFNKEIEADASFDRVVKLDPKSAEGWTQKCLALTGLEKYPQAIAACETALQLDQNWGRATPAVAWNYRGAALSRYGKPQEALLSFDWATKLNPDYSLAWTYRCRALYQEGNYTEALTACDRALQANQFWGMQTAAYGWANRAKVTQAMGLYDDAIDSYNKALATSSNDATIWTDYGNLLAKLGKYGQAQPAFESAVKLSPNYSFALVSQCTNFNRLEQYKEAATACETALQQGDGRWGKEGAAVAWSQQGNALTGLGKYQEAIASLNRAIALKPDYANAWSNRSVTLWHLGQYNDALVSNQRAIELDVTSSQAWYNQGRILTTLGQLDEAVAAYDRALRGNGYIGDKALLAEIWTNQCAALLKLQRYPEAVTAADSAIGFNPQSSAAWYNKALGLVAMRRYQDAAITYERAIAIEPNNANFWTGKGIALRFLARYPESMEALKKALELNPNQPQALVNRDIVMSKIQPPISP